VKNLFSQRKGDTDLNERSVADAVSALLHNRLNPRPFPGLPRACRPSNLTEAYDLQEALNVALTDAGFGNLVGHKVGCTSKVMQEYMNIPHPCSGSIFEASVYKSPASVPSTIFNNVGIECEVAVRLSDDCPASAGPYTKKSVYNHIKSCMSAIEIVDNRYENFRSLDLETMVADDFFQAACVLGEEITDWRDIDLAGLTGRAIVNEVEVGAGQGADILGHPFEALAWLANHKIARNRILRAGEIVLLGSVVKTQWLSPGDKVVIEVNDLGTISAEFSI